MFSMALGRRLRVTQFLIANLLVLSSQADARTVAEQVSRFHPGQRIQVAFANGDKVMGHLGQLSAEGFDFTPETRGSPARLVRYEEVKSVRAKWTKTAKWALGFGIWAGLALLGSRV